MYYPSSTDSLFNIRSDTDCSIWKIYSQSSRVLPGLEYLTTWSLDITVSEYNETSQATTGNIHDKSVAVEVDIVFFFGYYVYESKTCSFESIWPEPRARYFGQARVHSVKFHSCDPTFTRLESETRLDKSLVLNQ